MQVFIPLPDVAESVATLDTGRLGKQRVETYQLVLATFGLKPGTKPVRGRDGLPRLLHNGLAVTEWNGKFEPRVSAGWLNHPARLAWKDYLPALLEYQKATCNEWTSRGYADTCYNKTYTAFRWAYSDDLGLDVNDRLYLPEFRDWVHTIKMPWWWGRDDVHASHRSNLLRKNPLHYAQFGWTEPDDLDYVWPTQHEAAG